MSKLNILELCFSICVLTIFWTGVNFWSYGYFQIIAGQLAAASIGINLYKLR